MEPVTWIFGSIAIASISAGITKVITSNSCVKESTCAERRESDNKIGEMHFANIETKIDSLTEDVNEIKGMLKDGGSD